MLDGYNIIEERRKTGNRGGIAIYIKKQLTIEQTLGNEYGLYVKLMLPNSQRINIVNIYLPPAQSLKRRAITEAQATAHIEDIIDQTQPQLTTIVCGDFNARTGSQTPKLDTTHPPRTVSDPHICPRAKWLLLLCTKYQLYILNGTHTPATCTCHTSRGESLVDYILCNRVHLQVHHPALQPANISDHDLIYTHLPITAAHYES
jgi:endonuclease/exonuclease/phosphatase family metal-dependent hydrolase